MAEKGRQYILDLRKQWRFNLILSGILIALGGTLVVISLLYRIGGVSLWWSIPLFAMAVLLLFRIEKSWKIRDDDVYRFLNDRFPELEESSQLFLKPRDSLSVLEGIQSGKIESRLDGLPKLKHKNLFKRLFVFGAACLLAWVITIVPFDNMADGKLAGIAVSHTNASKNKPEVLPARVQSVNVSIIPPAYTRRSERKQEQFSLLVETGALIIWKIETTEPVNEMRLIFNDTESLKLQPLNKEKTKWELKKHLQKPGFYQLKVNDHLSELYLLETIKDQPASIRITSPKQYTTIDFGQPQKILLKVSINDDYGVTNAVIIATTASGRGEGVKFKEQELNFSPGINGSRRSYDLQRNIDLKSLGMVPGDELYFYVKAFDNVNQESRSEVYFVSIQDTAELMSMEGMTSGVDLVPEYFRSMRQIIIDTEKLIKDRPTISKEDFNNRSNSLGTDQKLLRLRYGKFLGEESNDIEHDDHAPEEQANFGDVSSILEEYGHNHDNAEDATFFEPELKSQLKATLTEMWNSELRLRTYKPVEALPYEYKALRLLKDLQQKSRVYVGKTSIKTQVLKPEVRLTGELDKIINPFSQRNFSADSDPLIALKQSPQVINKLKERKKIDIDDRQILISTNKILSAKASSDPSVYLGAVISLRKIISDEKYVLKPSELMLIEKALQKAIPGTLKAPYSTSSGVGSDLSKQYFKNLNRLQQ